VVPVVNENDTTATDEIRFGDNDVLAAQVAIMLRADLLVLLTDQDGSTPRTRACPEARLVRVSRPATWPRRRRSSLPRRRRYAWQDPAALWLAWPPGCAR
jgi:hypothetical protein